jgi:hypothetical protein
VIWLDPAGNGSVVVVVGGFVVSVDVGGEGSVVPLDIVVVVLLVDP